MLGMKPCYTGVILCHFLQSMLVKVKLGDTQKFVRITELSLEDFLSAGKNILSLYYFRRFYDFFFLIYVLLDGCLVILYENILYSHMLMFKVHHRFVKPCKSYILSHKISYFFLSIFKVWCPSCTRECEGF